MMKQRILIILFFGLSTVGRIAAQDFQYSQPFAIPMYMNPAFTGNGIVDCKDSKTWNSLGNFKGSIQNRTQWNNTFMGNLIAAEYSWGKLGKGLGKNKNTKNDMIWSFGLHLNIDRNNTIRLTQNYLALSTSVDVPLNDPQYTLKFGYQVGILNRVLNQKNFNFADEFNGSGFDLNSTSEVPDLGDSKFSWDVGSVGALYGNKSITLGAGVHHIAEPNQSVWNGQDKLRRRYSGLASWSFKIRWNKSKVRSRVYFVSSFKNQGTKNQWDGGVFWQQYNSNYKQSLFRIGVWYRGIPFQKSPDNFIQNDALVGYLGIMLNQVSLDFSRDFSVSKSKVFGGAFEIALRYQIISDKCGKEKLRNLGNRTIYCPVSAEVYPWME